MAIKSLPLNVHCTNKVGLQWVRRYFSRSSSSYSGKASRRDFTGAVTTLSSFSNRVAVFLSSMHTYSISHLTFSSGHSVFCLKNEKKNYWTWLITTDLKICRTTGNIYKMKVIDMYRKVGKLTVIVVLDVVDKDALFLKVFVMQSETST